MTEKRFVYFSAVVFGLFALFVAGRAVPNALWYPRNIYHDILRFGFIAATLAVGLVSIFPHRSVPAVRQLAAQTSSGPVRLLIAVAMVICLFVARLSGVAGLWIVPIAGGFFIAFIFPGLAFRKLPANGADAAGVGWTLTPRELGQAVGVELRAGPKSLRYLFVVFYGLIVLGVFWMVAGLRAIPSPFWSELSAWGALLSGGLATALFALPVFRLMPRGVHRQALPSLVILFCVLLAISTFGFRLLLRDVVPVTAAYLWGHDATQKATVVTSRPQTRRKGWHGSVDIETSVGVIEVWNLPPDLLGELSTGDKVLIVGRATRLGQAVQKLTPAD